MAQTKKKLTKAPGYNRSKKVGSAVRTRTVHHFDGFADFIRTSGVVGLAIGFVMGAQSKSLVDSFTFDILNPLLGLILPGSGELTGRTLGVYLFGKEATFQTGKFAWAVINFIIIALVIYIIFKMLKLEKLDKPKN